MVMMMTGYKKAADVMVEAAAADRIDRDSLVYPIIFNYRQFLELSLKYLISTYGHTVGLQPMWKPHDLGALWKSFASMLKLYGQDGSEEADGIVAEVVADLSKMDPGSFSYRYPVDIKGKPIPIAHDELNLTVLADVMQAVEGYLTGCDGYLDHLQSAMP